MRIVIASVFLCLFVAVCLLVLIGLREKVLTGNPAFTYEEPAEIVKIDQAPMRYEDVRKLLENQLINGPDSMGWQKMPPHNGVEVRKIFGEFPSQIFLAELARHIEQTGTPAQLKVSRKKGLIHLFWSAQLKMELLYTVPERPVVTVPQVKRAKIAIIMDDIGGSISAVKGLLDYELPVTPAILPGTRDASRSVSLLRQSAREYMIHIPMEPLSYPRVSPGENALLVNLAPEQIRNRMRDYFAAVPGAVGSNNHMGSRFTEAVDPMRIVLQELKSQGHFFIDSRTIGDSVAFNEARKMGVKTATRNIFLDNETDVAAIRKQIRKMVRLAGTDREIVAICHPHKETFVALRQELNWLKEQGVDFVAASELVHVY